MEEQKLDNKKRTILIIIAVLILTIGVTLAYIIAQLQDETRGNASVISDTVDVLNFEVDKDITLNPNQFNVTEGGSNLSDTAVGSAILRANSTDNNATYNYYVYFRINTNNYIYTTPEQTPEMVLTITDPNDNPVTNISGLDYVTSGGVSGFDITTKSGLFNVAELYEITSTSSTEDTIQKWTFTASFINLDTNQADNGGKTLEAEIILSREPKYTLANYIIENEYVEDGVNGLYYHDGVGSYTNADQEAGDNSYRYSGGDYEIAESYQGTYSQIYGGVIKKYCDGVEDTTFIDDCSGNFYYTLAYDSNNTQYTKISDALEQAVNDSYLTDDNIKNYVCFGSDAPVCPTENLYRIIGVFGDEVKLIKADYTTSEMLGTNSRDYVGILSEIGAHADYYNGTMNTSAIAIYRWNYDTSVSELGSNDWTTSELNTINLNTNYLNYLGEPWSEMISNTTWYLGGISDDEMGAAKAYYNAEKNNAGYNNNPVIANGKIGLMYVSDYGYAANPDYWTTDLFYYHNARSNNWMYMGFYELTLSPSYLAYFYTYNIWSYGGLEFYTSIMENSAVRPVFYLNSNTVYSSGDGSIDNPYRIEI